MTRTRINHFAAIMPLILSGAAFALALWAGMSGWGRGLPDEGAGAHLFHLLIAVEIPVIALFLWTAERAQSRSTLGLLLCQLAAIGLAFAPVAFFRL